MRNWTVFAGLWLSLLGPAHANSGPPKHQLLAYFIVDSSAKPLEGVRIFVIGENHSFDSDVAAAAHLIRAYGQSGDVLLLEGAGIAPAISNQATRPALQWASQDLLVGGWDDRDAVVKFIASVKTSLSLGERVNSPGVGFFERRSLIAQAETLEVEREKLMRQRHAAMRAKIMSLASSSPGKRIFIVAGTSHVSPADHPELKSCLARTGLAFATLLPNQHNPNRRRTQTENQYRSRVVMGQRGLETFQ